MYSMNVTKDTLSIFERNTLFSFNSRKPLPTQNYRNIILSYAKAKFFNKLGVSSGCFLFGLIEKFI